MREEKEQENGKQDEFEFYFSFTKPLVLDLPSSEDKAIAAAWVQKLEAEPESKEEKEQRLNYLKLLLFVLQRGRLSGIFKKQPPSGPLQPFPQGFSTLDMGNLMLDQDDGQVCGGGDARIVPYNIEISNDLLEFVASQEIPNFGIQMYYAWSSDEPIHKWASFDEEKFPQFILDKIKQLKAIKSDDKYSVVGGCIKKKKGCDFPMQDKYSKKKVKSPQEVERSQGRSFHTYVGLVRGMGNFNEKCNDDQDKYQKQDQRKGKPEARNVQRSCPGNGGEAEDMAPEEEYDNLVSGLGGLNAQNKPCLCPFPCHHQDSPEHQKGGRQSFEESPPSGSGRCEGRAGGPIIQNNVSVPSPIQTRRRSGEPCPQPESDLIMPPQGYNPTPQSRNNSPNRPNLECPPEDISGFSPKQNGVCVCSSPPCTCPCPRSTPVRNPPSNANSSAMLSCGNPNATVTKSPPKDPRCAARLPGRLPGQYVGNTSTPNSCTSDSSSTGGRTCGNTGAKQELNVIHCYDKSNPDPYLVEKGDSTLRTPSTGGFSPGTPIYMPPANINRVRRQLFAPGANSTFVDGSSFPAIEMTNDKYFSPIKGPRSPESGSHYLCENSLEEVQGPCPRGAPTQFPSTQQQPPPCPQQQPPCPQQQPPCPQQQPPCPQQQPPCPQQQPPCPQQQPPRPQQQPPCPQQQPPCPRQQPPCPRQQPPCPPQQQQYQQNYFYEGSSADETYLRPLAVTYKKPSSPLANKQAASNYAPCGTSNTSDRLADMANMLQGMKQKTEAHREKCGEGAVYRSPRPEGNAACYSGNLQSKTQIKSRQMGYDGGAEPENCAQMKRKMRGGPSTYSAPYSAPQQYSPREDFPGSVGTQNRGFIQQTPCPPQKMQQQLYSPRQMQQLRIPQQKQQPCPSQQARSPQQMQQRTCSPQQILQEQQPCPPQQIQQQVRPSQQMPATMPNQDCYPPPNPDEYTEDYDDTDGTYDPESLDSCPPDFSHDLSETTYEEECPSQNVNFDSVEWFTMLSAAQSSRQTSSSEDDRNCVPLAPKPGSGVQQGKCVSSAQRSTPQNCGSGNRGAEMQTASCAPQKCSPMQSANNPAQNNAGCRPAVNMQYLQVKGGSPSEYSNWPANSNPEKPNVRYGPPSTQQHCPANGGNASARSVSPRSRLQETVTYGPKTQQQRCPPNGGSIGPQTMSPGGQARRLSPVQRPAFNFEDDGAQLPCQPGTGFQEMQSYASPRQQCCPPNGGTGGPQGKIPGGACGQYDGQMSAREGGFMQYDENPNCDPQMMEPEPEDCYDEFLDTDDGDCDPAPVPQT